MNLGDLLQLLRGSILNDRTDRTSGSSDYLWEDATLVTFINEAQRRFAVQGLVLRDSTTDEVTKVTLVEGQATYPLHESIIGVMSLKRATREADITRVGHSVFGAYRAPTETWQDVQSYTGLPAGCTVAYSTDESVSDQDSDSLSQVILRVYPTPGPDQEGEVLRMRVVRKPIEELRVGNLGAQPELPADHHIEMLDYAAYLALRIIDDDAGARKAAFEFKATFEESIREAKALAMRKMFAPTGPAFGRGGFSWDS